MIILVNLDYLKLIQLHLKGNINKFEITELSHLETFLYEFHAGIQSLNIQSVKPLAKSDYKLQKPQNKDSETKSKENDNDKPKEDKNRQLWRLKEKR